MAEDPKVAALRAAGHDAAADCLSGSRKMLPASAAMWRLPQSVCSTRTPLRRSVAGRARRYSAVSAPLASVAAGSALTS